MAKHHRSLLEVFNLFFTTATVIFLWTQQGYATTCSSQNLYNQGQVDAFALGINTILPGSGLEIKGSDLFINDTKRGIILKNFNGECFRIVLEGKPGFKSVSINCPN